MSCAANGPLRRLYGVEQNNDCDVAFYASDNWRLPAHSDLLKESNVVFRAMLAPEFTYPTEDGTGLTKVDISDVDGRALDNLLRCLYGYPVPVQSIDTALLTLYAAHKYQCPELVNLCISFLTFHLKDTNVLSVLKFAKVLAVEYKAPEISVAERNAEKSRRRNRKAPTRKRRPFDRRERPVPEEMPASAPLLTSDLDTIETACSDLLQTCLTLIDAHAAQILDSDELEELDLDTLTLILSRDTLNVSDEVKVFEALDRWAEQQCKQQQLTLTVGSKRRVLKDSIFLPRYLTMTLKAWQLGPLKSGIFATEEVDIIEGLLKGHVTLTQVTSPEAPLFRLSSHPRRPLLPSSDATKLGSARLGPTRHRHRKFSVFCRFFRFERVRCCKKASSADSSPLSSTPTSPERQGQRSLTPPPAPPNRPITARRESQTARINVLEQMVICFACLFD